MATTDRQHKYFADQFDDETVLFVFRKHPVVMRKGLIIAALGLLAGPLYILALTLIYRNDPSKFPTTGTFFLSLFASVVLAAILFMPAYIGWYFSVFILSDQRFIQINQKGLFHRAVADIGIQQVQSVSYEVAGLQETLLGFGTITMQTFVGNVTIHYIHHPAKVQKRIMGILREQGIAGKSTPPPQQQVTNTLRDDSNNDIPQDRIAEEDI